MKKTLFAFIVLCVTTLFTLHSQNDFPYNNPLISTTGLTSKFSIAHSYNLPKYFENEGMVITDYTSQIMALGIDDLTFSTEEGFMVDFVFSMYMDSDLKKLNVTPGNGFAFVLSPADSKNMDSGFGGAGLGYANNLTFSAGIKTGFKEGYLGIGFDAVGTYKASMYDLSGQNQSTGFGYNWRIGIDDLADDVKYSGSDITIRGPYNKSYIARSSFHGGYPVLHSFITTGKSPNTYQINATDGTYSTYTKDSAPFKLLSDTISLDPNNTNYRRCILSLIPGNTESGKTGFYLNLSIYHGQIRSTILKDYFIDTSATGSIIYNDIKSATSGSQTNPENVVKTLSLTPPRTLCIAFTASTDLKYALRQIISNLNIVLPFSPELPDTSVDDVCKTLKRSSLFTVLDDALGYDNNIYTPSNPPVARRSNIDLTSFKFKIYDASSGRFVDAPQAYICTTAAGKYTYNPKTGEIIFVPSAGAASLDQDFIYYNIKNKKPSDTSLDVLSNERHRSRTAKATINLTDTNCPPIPNRYVKINK